MKFKYTIYRNIGSITFYVYADRIMDDKIYNIVDEIISKFPKDYIVFKEDITELLLYKRLELKFVSS